VSYTATVMRLGGGTWTGDDIDLSEVDDFDALIDLLRELDGEVTTLVLFLEEDDEYLAIVRTTREREPVTFISDRRVLTENTAARRLLGDDLPTGEVELSEEESARPEVEPAGDPDLLADLGVGEEILIRLCSEEGMLPADVIFEVCERIGCGPVLEELRGI
jgi:putative tRNA adenosine deaminase-associated protein